LAQFCTHGSLLRKFAVVRIADPNVPQANRAGVPRVTATAALAIRSGDSAVPPSGLGIREIFRRARGGQGTTQRNNILDSSLSMIYVLYLFFSGRWERCAYQMSDARDQGSDGSSGFGAMRRSFGSANASHS